ASSKARSPRSAPRNKCSAAPSGVPAFNNPCVTPTPSAAPQRAADPPSRRADAHISRCLQNHLGSFVTRPFGSLLRMRRFVCGSKTLPHPEERAERASRRTHLSRSETLGRGGQGLSRSFPLEAGLRHRLSLRLTNPWPL